MTVRVDLECVKVGARVADRGQSDDVGASKQVRAEVDCARLARLLQAQIMGLRAFATRDVPDEQIAALADDMSSLLDGFRVQPG